MSSLIDTTKTVYDLAKKGMTIELQEKVMQLREEALELQEENFRLRKENRELKEKIESKEKMKFKRKVYFRDDDEIPFCPYCFEKSNLLIHLNGPVEWKEEGRLIGMIYGCQECGTEYITKEGGDFTIYSPRNKKR